MSNVQADGVVVTAEIHWTPFIPSEWIGRGSCYPCLVWDMADDIIFAPCDPWSLPPDNDYSTWLCTPSDCLIPKREQQNA